MKASAAEAYEPHAGAVDDSQPVEVVDGPLDLFHSMRRLLRSRGVLNAHPGLGIDGSVIGRDYLEHEHAHPDYGLRRIGRWKRAIRSEHGRVETVRLNHQRIALALDEVRRVIEATEPRVPRPGPPVHDLLTT